MSIVIDKLPNFANLKFSHLNDAMKEGARDILVLAKNRAPFDKGGLRSDTEVKRIPNGWRIGFWKEYARFQEFGGDSKRTVRNYKTPGTGKKYLKSSGDDVASNMLYKIKKHATRSF